MADEITITLSADLLNLPANLERALRQGQAEASFIVIRNSQRKIQEVGAVASKRLFFSVRELERKPGVISVGSTLPQAGIIENGRRPGQKIPPWRIFKPILEAWAHAKGLQIDNLYPVALKIKRDGIKARHPFKFAVEESIASGEIDRGFQRELAKVA